MAVALMLPYNTNKSPEKASFIKKFIVTSIKAVDKFLKFIKVNSIKLHFWSQYI